VNVKITIIFTISDKSKATTACYCMVAKQQHMLQLTMSHKQNESVQHLITLTETYFESWYITENKDCQRNLSRTIWQWNKNNTVDDNNTAVIPQQLEW